MRERVFLPIVVLAWAATLLMAQDAPSRYAMLQNALALSDAQLALIAQSDSGGQATLSSGQKDKLKEIERVLQRAEIYQAVSVGLIDARQWLGGFLCYDEISSEGLDLSPVQFQKLQQLQNSSRQDKLKVLNASQAKRVAEFEAQLKVLKDAIRLKLVTTTIRPTLGGEMLCH